MVSILGLLDYWIRIKLELETDAYVTDVSILGLLDYWIRIFRSSSAVSLSSGFNPWFVGLLDKNSLINIISNDRITSFNPWFVGLLDKNCLEVIVLTI